MSPHDPLAYWEDHAACWRMQYRGSLGKQARKGFRPLSAIFLLLFFWEFFGTSIDVL